MLGFLLASFGFVEFFYILLERSQEIQQHMVFLLSPIIRSMTVVSNSLRDSTVPMGSFDIVQMSNTDDFHFMC